MPSKHHLHSLFAALGVPLPGTDAGGLVARSPIDGATLARLPVASADETADAIERSSLRFRAWRDVPAPKRGELIRVFANRVRVHKETLGTLITLETGKILQEGLGEVQEVVDICDFAIGLSRQLYGLTIASERPDHKLLETWHPLGVVGIITAFNFPMAVYAWNAALALVAGNTVVWKPSEKTPLSAIALNGLMQASAVELGLEAQGLSELLVGGREVGEALVANPAVKLVSATGSSAMGKQVGVACAQHFKRSLLELGGNNAAIVTPSARLALVLRAATFAAAGTAGQRCTSLRRLIVHRSVYRQTVDSLAQAFGRLPVGDPLSPDILVGPLVDEMAFEAMQRALERARGEGGVVHFGERVATDAADAWYVRPALVEMERQSGPMLEETFAPILYITPYDSLDEAIALNNGTVHGLSSAIFTENMREAEVFTSSRGSDCGIANVNIGTSGAEIGGAFGGEKETGGGRESGSDAWKLYMRRATNTVNYGESLPLAQGVRFDV